MPPVPLVGMGVCRLIIGGGWAGKAGGNLLIGRGRGGGILLLLLIVLPGGGWGRLGPPYLSHPEQTTNVCVL